MEFKPPMTMFTGKNKKRKILPCNRYKTQLMNEESQSRLAWVQSLMPGIDVPDLFRRGIFIAGGAALYVLDQQQKTWHLGDVDFWVPPEQDEFVKSLVHGYSGRRLIDFSSRIIYLHIERVKIQFIRMDPGMTVRDLLNGFDYDVVQCAIIDEKYCMTSWAFLSSLESRKIHWKNVSQTHRSRHQNSVRKNKLRWKGFNYGTWDNSPVIAPSSTDSTGPYYLEKPSSTKHYSELFLTKDQIEWTPVL